MTHRDRSKDRDAHRMIFTVGVHAVRSRGQTDRRTELTKCGEELQMLLRNADDGTVLYCTVNGMRFFFFK